MFILFRATPPGTAAAVGQVSLGDAGDGPTHSLLPSATWAALSAGCRVVCLLRSTEAEMGRECLVKGSPDTAYCS